MPVFTAFFLSCVEFIFQWSEIYCKWHLQIHAGPDNFWHETHKTRSREANHKFKFHKKAIHRGLKTLSLAGWAKGSSIDDVTIFFMKLFDFSLLDIYTFLLCIVNCSSISWPLPLKNGDVVYGRPLTYKLQPAASLPACLMRWLGSSTETHFIYGISALYCN